VSSASTRDLATRSRPISEGHRLICANYQRINIPLNSRPCQRDRKFESIPPRVVYPMFTQFREAPIGSHRRSNCRSCATLGRSWAQLKRIPTSRAWRMADGVGRVMTVVGSQITVDPVAAHSVNSSCRISAIVKVCGGGVGSFTTAPILQSLSRSTS
jgi:hypothetical protein